MNGLELPETIANVEQLEELLSCPTDAAVQAVSRVDGDIIVLGVAGKMGPTLARMVKRASDLAGGRRKVIGVSRFSDAQSRLALQSHGIETIQGDLLQPEFIDTLPEAPNVIFMTGMKFGTGGKEAMTWAMNTYLPSLVCRKFRHGRIVAFSTGNVYGMVPAGSSGSLETDTLRPDGEYAMSAMGRERTFDYFCQTYGIPTALVRLNYAVEMRYGVLVDLAQKVFDEQVIDLSMGYVNVIWQGDASAMTVCMLPDASCPLLCLNVAGPERLSARAVCEQFGRCMGKAVRFTGVESREGVPHGLLDALARLFQLKD